MPTNPPPPQPVPAGGASERVAVAWIKKFRSDNGVSLKIAMDAYYRNFTDTPAASPSLSSAGGGELKTPLSPLLVKTLECLKQEVADNIGAEIISSPATCVKCGSRVHATTTGNILNRCECGGTMKTDLPACPATETQWMLEAARQILHQANWLAEQGVDMAESNAAAIIRRHSPSPTAAPSLSSAGGKPKTALEFATMLSLERLIDWHYTEKLARYFEEWRISHSPSPTAAPDGTGTPREYPNIEAITNGTISGRFSDWVAVKPEAIALLAELASLRTQLAQARQQAGESQNIHQIRELEQQRTDLRRSLAVKEGELAEAKKQAKQSRDDYLTVADAVAAQSDSPDHLAEIARATRAALVTKEEELAYFKSYVVPEKDKHGKYWHDLAQERIAQLAAKDELVAGLREALERIEQSPMAAFDSYQRALEDAKRIASASLNAARASQPAPQEVAKP